MVLAFMKRFFPSLRRLFSKSPLMPVIAQAIREEGPMTLQRYMDIVLQHPTYGYYRQNDPIGIGKDFGTAPEVTQMFGEMMGIWCVDAWQKMGQPESFVLLELGPGHGTMMNDLLRFTESYPEFRHAIKLRLFESNATLREMQKQKLEQYRPIFLDRLEDLDPLPLIVLANEFFDNISTRQFIKLDDGWHETVICLAKGKLALGLNDIPLPDHPDALEKEFGDEKKDIPANWVHEFSEPSRDIIRKLAVHIVRHGGAAAIVDYGYVKPKGEGTVDSWRTARAGDILKSPGEADVTADVDFRALALIAEKEGAIVEEIVGQGEFLSKQGLYTRARFLKERGSKEARKHIDEALRILVQSDVGKIWKVLALRAPQSTGEEK